MLFRFLPQNNIILSCMAKKSSCEEAAFLENWITFILHVYSSPWPDQASLHLDNSHLKKCFKYNPTIMFSFNQISHSYQGGVAQIQQQILHGRPYSFKRVLHQGVPFCMYIYIYLMGFRKKQLINALIRMNIMVIHHD